MPRSRAVLITGCSTGMGREVALTLHRAGHPVYATARRPETLTALAEAGITVLALDVLDEDSMAAAVAAVEEKHGSVGVLLNNAGYGLMAPVEEANLDDVRRQFETNVFGLVRLTQLVLPGMRRAGGGRIVNISSMGGKFSPPGGAFYHGSKHAVEALSDSLRLEVAPFGVEVVVVEPGPVTTEFVGTSVSTRDSGTTRAADRDGTTSADGPYTDFLERLAQRYVAAVDGRRRNLAVSTPAAARVIAKACTTARPRTRYPVGVMARAVIVARRLLPDRLFDRVVRSQFPVPRPTGASAGAAMERVPTAGATTAGVTETGDGPATSDRLEATASTSGGKAS